MLVSFRLWSLSPSAGLSLFQTQRAPRVSFTNRFCGLAFFRFAFCFPLSRKVCRLSPFLCVRYPCVCRSSFAPFCRFPVFLSGAPSGWWWSPLFVSVSWWFLLCPPCFLCPVFAVPRFLPFLLCRVSYTRNASGARWYSIENRCKITAFWGADDFRIMIFFAFFFENICKLLKIKNLPLCNTDFFVYAPVSGDIVSI